LAPLEFRRAPLLAAAVCFALGEAFSKLPPAAPRPTVLLLFCVLALVALTLFALRRTLRLAVLPAAALWAAAGLWAVQIEPAPSPQTALLAYADGLSRTVQGRVERIRTLPAHAQSPDNDIDPDQWDEPGTPSTSFDLEVDAIEDVTPDTSRMVEIAGGVRATLFADADARQQPQLHCGDVVEVPLRLRAPERYGDPGAWQYADYLLDQGIAATANVPAAKLRLLGGVSSHAGLGATLQCRIFAAQSWAAARLPGYTRSTANRRLPAMLRLTPEDAGMLNAMLFGDRSRLTHGLRLGFERTGSFHLFVVSGMHVALLAGLLFWVARRMRLRPWLATLLTLTLTYAYAVLTGFGVPVQRALLMTAVFLLARLLSRERNTLNALGAAALSVLVWSPRALFEASFQMTFLAIVAIAGIAMPLGERSFLRYAHAGRGLGQRWRDAALPPRLAQFRVMLRLWGEALEDVRCVRLRALPAALIRLCLWAAELALIGLVAEAVMVLPMALYFHRATVFALPANMVSIPLVGVLAALGIATFVGSLISPWIAALPGSGMALLLHAITGLIQRVSHAQAADVRVPGPTLLHALLAVVCFAFSCWGVRRSGATAWIAIAVLPLAGAIVLWPVAAAVHAGELEVTAIDVGQGDSLLVVGPGGSTMLVDAGGPTGAAANGENAAGSSGFDVGEEVVSSYLWSRQIRRLDVVALTHAHSDHMGGMPAALLNFRPRELWVAVDPNSAPYRALLAEAATLGIRVRHLRAGDRIAWDSIDISVLAPTPAYVNPGPPINNDSLVLHMQFGAASALLEGDAEAPSEHAMVVASLAGRDAARIGPVTLLKVGHHGSRTSTTPEFLALAAPEDAVISVGRGNTFGHPRPEVVARLAQEHARLFRTDQFGLTTFLMSRDGKISALNPGP
jgi:competence protein ComEC